MLAAELAADLGQGEENAAIVNALQRHASIVVQKSLHEGFGLTVAEAMWKRRPVVASAVGGIRDQVRDGVDGLLLSDPSNLAAFNEQLVRVLSDPALATRLGEAAYERVKNCFTSISSLEEWAALVTQLLSVAQSAVAAPRRASGAAEVTGAP